MIRRLPRLCAYLLMALACAVAAAGLIVTIIIGFGMTNVLALVIVIIVGFILAAVSATILVAVAQLVLILLRTEEHLASCIIELRQKTGD